MLDLQKLEKSVDEALASETSESLTAWLQNQRDKNLSDFLGKGNLEMHDKHSRTLKRRTHVSMPVEVEI
jgi:hypothetical protein